MRTTERTSNGLESGGKWTSNYLVYGEWKAGKDELEMSVVEKSSDTRAHVKKCPWFVAWKENDLLIYGRFFCLEVGEALISGEVNNKLEPEIGGTQTQRCGILRFGF